jgi:hypothetical protein
LFQTAGIVPALGIGRQDKRLFALVSRLPATARLRQRGRGRPLGPHAVQQNGRGYLGPFAAEPATSWAAPHRTGIAARILSLRPNLKPFEMKTILYWLDQATTDGVGLAVGRLVGGIPS